MPGRMSDYDGQGKSRSDEARDSVSMLGMLIVGAGAIVLLLILVWWFV